MPHIPLDGTQLRAARDDDADGLATLISASYDEHPGCVLDLPGVDADLTAPATTAATVGGRWWVLERDGILVGSIGTGPVEPTGALELTRCYLAADFRGRGLATRLITRVETHAAALGARQVTLWSDSRFVDAHHRYTNLGYRDTGERRQLHDPSDTTEHRFVKDLEVDEGPPPVRWEGPFGTDEVVARPLPDGSVLRGGVGTTRYSIEVDHAWRPRCVTLDRDGQRTRFSSDGEGRWWRDGRPDDEVAGCTDIGLEVTPAAVQVAVRRLGLGTGESGTSRLALVSHPDAKLHAMEVRYDRAGVHSYRQYLGGEVHIVEVDNFGLPVQFGDLWRRVELEDGAVEERLTAS